VSVCSLEQETSESASEMSFSLLALRSSSCGGDGWWLMVIVLDECRRVRRVRIGGLEEY
jgi:hypothetical protein